ncbi:MAG: alternate-type signal peptide domain-containing protein [Bifidobacteriaceae bacterium]|jgi:alternate signal-mediated exported protein|nr:alternate-type signal peptide domain-containing protein [Bifidobacteriaceae bacterium]
MKNSTSRFSARTKGVIAGAAGVALLLGGSTFALWTTSDMLDAGTVNTGTMSVTANTAGLKLYDVSLDRSNDDSTTTNVTLAATGLPGHEVTAVELVPGDTLAVVYPFTIDMSGDNLVGKLSAQATKLTTLIDGAEGAATAGEIRYQVHLGTGSAPVVANAAAFGNLPTLLANTELGYFANGSDEDANKPSGAATVSTLPTGGQVTLIVYITFPDTTADLFDAGIQNEDLTDITLTLDQARDTGKANFKAKA